MTGSPGKVEILCEHCGSRCEVAVSLKGGFAPCNHCGKATSVPGGWELAYWLLLVTGLLAGLAATWLAFLVGGAVPALATGAISVVLILALRFLL